MVLFLPQCPTLYGTGTSVLVVVLGMPDQGDDYAENNQILNFSGRKGWGGIGLEHTTLWQMAFGIQLHNMAKPNCSSTIEMLPYWSIWFKFCLIVPVTFLCSRGKTSVDIFW